MCVYTHTYINLRFYSQHHKKKKRDWGRKEGKKGGREEGNMEGKKEVRKKKGRKKWILQFYL